jgi:hypothetical protein
MRPKPCKRMLLNISNDDKISLMKDELELELLLSFDGASYQASEGYVAEFTVKTNRYNGPAAGWHKLRVGFPTGEWRALRSIRQRPRA